MGEKEVFIVAPGWSNSLQANTRTAGFPEEKGVNEDLLTSTPENPVLLYVLNVLRESRLHCEAVN